MVLFLLSSCGGNTDPDPVPEPGTEIVEECHTTDLDYCVRPGLAEDVLELIYSRFTGKAVPCAEAEVVFVSEKDLDDEAIWDAYESGAAVVVVSPTAEVLVPILRKRSIGIHSIDEVGCCLFVAFHRSGIIFSMDDHPAGNINGLVSWVKDVNATDTSGEDLLQATHISSVYDFSLKNETIFEDKKGKLQLSGEGRFEQYYSIIPLYAFTSDKSNYVGDFYLVDAYWLGCKRGFFTDNETDLSVAMGFPYILMDGMNEKGFAVGVLHLDGEATWQDSGKKKIATTVAMRYLLDNAVDVEDAISKLQEFDMRCSDRTNGSYHFFMADASGKSAVIEYIYDGEGSLPNTFEPLRDAKYVTNFYISPKMASASLKSRIGATADFPTAFRYWSNKPLMFFSDSPTQQLLMSGTFTRKMSRPVCLASW